MATDAAFLFEYALASGNASRHHLDLSENHSASQHQAQYRKQP
jgi:hypothetical protein